jgi:hypothetical protein
MNLARRFTLTTATVALGIFQGQNVRSDEPLVVPVGETAVVAEEPIQIIPSNTLAAPQHPMMLDSAGVPIHNGVTAADYRRVYDSIRFSRSEYRVNPNYRHDSTMEILTGNSRHQTIVQHNHEHRQPVQRNPEPARPSRVLVPFSGSSFYWNSLPWLWRF